MLDGDAETYIKSADDIVISMNAPLHSTVYSSKRLSARMGKEWKTYGRGMDRRSMEKIAHATNIGYKRILRFPEVTTDKIRIRINKVRLTPAISNISAHHYQSRPLNRVLKEP